VLPAPIAGFFRLDLNSVYSVYLDIVLIICMWELSRHDSFGIAARFVDGQNAHSDPQKRTEPLLADGVEVCHPSVTHPSDEVS